MQTSLLMDDSHGKKCLPTIVFNAIINPIRIAIKNHAPFMKHKIELWHNGFLLSKHVISIREKEFRGWLL